jgi:hypothetical protein
MKQVHVFGQPLRELSLCLGRYDISSFLNGLPTLVGTGQPDVTDFSVDPVGRSGREGRTNKYRDPIRVDMTLT